jgi:hypothetical protein
MEDITWYGITRTKSANEWFLKACNDLNVLAKARDWAGVFQILENQPTLVNMSKVGGKTLFTPMHHAANQGEPVEVVERLLALGAWRTLENVRGERPLDVADRMGHSHLKSVLSPVYKHSVPLGVLLKIQDHFHSVIHGRVAELVLKHALRLPELHPLLELEVPKIWFPVPGMYGGFNFWLETFGVNAKLITDSWCRMFEGSDERHEIDSRGVKAISDGFT